MSVSPRFVNSIFYPAINRTTDNLDKGSAKAVVILEDMETVSNDITEISGSIRKTLTRVDTAFERIEASADSIGATVTIVKDQFGELDTASTDLAENIQRVRGRVGELDALFEQLRDTGIGDRIQGSP